MVEDAVLDEAELRARLVARVLEDHAAISGALAGARLEQLRQLTLTLGQLKLLLRLVATGGATTNGLAEHLGVTTAAVSPVVDKLVCRGLVVRRPDADDRRVKHLLPSPEGTRLVGELFEESSWTRHQVLSTLSLSGLRALADGVAEVRSALADPAPRTDPTPSRGAR